MVRMNTKSSIWLSITSPLILSGPALVKGLWRLIFIVNFTGFIVTIETHVQVCLIKYLLKKEDLTWIGIMVLHGLESWNERQWRKGALMKHSTLSAPWLLMWGGQLTHTRHHPAIKRLNWTLKCEPKAPLLSFSFFPPSFPPFPPFSYLPSFAFVRYYITAMRSVTHTVAYTKFNYLLFCNN